MTITRFPAVVLNMNLTRTLLQNLLDSLFVVVKFSFCNCTYGLIGNKSLCNFNRWIEIVEDVLEIFIIDNREGLIRFYNPVDKFLLKDSLVKTFDQHIDQVLFLWLFGIELQDRGNGLVCFLSCFYRPLLFACGIHD